MDTNPQIAIMMPVYNGEKTLPLAIKSIEAQTYQNWKCYIVNDGSTDSTKEILDALTDTRFVVIHFKENKGRPIARQTSLDAAEGEYIAFLDADDIFHPEKLEKQVRILENHKDIDLVSCGNLCYGNNFTPVSYRGLGKGIVQEYNDDKKVTMALRTSLLRLKECKKVSFKTDLMLAEDTDFLEKFLPNRKYLIQDEILYYYSEFDSVDKFKIWTTYYYGILRHLKNLKKAPLVTFKKIIYVLIKWFFFTLSLPFFSTEKVLAKRGNKPTEEMISEFNYILKEYGIK